MGAPRFGQDLALIIISVIFAIFIVESQIIHKLLAIFSTNVYVTSFFAGLFFTSIFTTAPAIVILGELSQEGGVLLVALSGGVGAVIGDYVLFRFFKDRFAEDIKEMFSSSNRRKWEIVFKKKVFRFLTPLLGAIVIASPFPDEFGIMLLGMSHIRTAFFIPISFVFNTIGILIIGVIANFAI